MYSGPNFCFWKHSGTEHNPWIYIDSKHFQINTFKPLKFVKPLERLFKYWKPTVGIKIGSTCILINKVIRTFIFRAAVVQTFFRSTVVQTFICRESVVQIFFKYTVVQFLFIYTVVLIIIFRYTVVQTFICRYKVVQIFIYLFRVVQICILRNYGPKLVVTKWSEFLSLDAQWSKHLFLGTLVQSFIFGYIGVHTFIFKYIMFKTCIRKHTVGSNICLRYLVVQLF